MQYSPWLWKSTLTRPVPLLPSGSQNCNCSSCLPACLLCDPSSCSEKFKALSNLSQKPPGGLDPWFENLRYNASPKNEKHYNLLNSFKAQIGIFQHPKLLASTLLQILLDSTNSNSVRNMYFSVLLGYWHNGTAKEKWPRKLRQQTEREFHLENGRKGIKIFTAAGKRSLIILDWTELTHRSGGGKLKNSSNY